MNIEFTREMEGQFRLELNYERIMLDGVETSCVDVMIEQVVASLRKVAIAIEEEILQG